MAKKKRSLKSVKKQADDLFSLIIRKRDRQKCFFEKYQFDPEFKIGKCGGPMCCFHIFSRVSNAVRFDPDNCVCSCMGHNMSMEFVPLEFYRLFEKVRGIEWVENMRRKWRGHLHIGYFGYIDLIEKFKKELE